MADNVRPVNSRGRAFAAPTPVSCSHPAYPQIAVERLVCKVVCGGANNPLASDKVAHRLWRRGITHVPDFIANAGATIQDASTAIGEEHLVATRLAAVVPLVREVVDWARRENRSPLGVAVEMADARIATLRETAGR